MKIRLPCDHRSAKRLAEEDETPGGLPIPENAKGKPLKALVGVLMRGDVAEQAANLSVQRAKRTELETASLSGGLGGALARMCQGECRIMMVNEDEKVVGVLTVGNIGELPAREAAGRQTGALAARPRGRTGP